MTIGPVLQAGVKGQNGSIQPLPGIGTALKVPDKKYSQAKKKVPKKKTHLGKNKYQKQNTFQQIQLLQ